MAGVLGIVCVHYDLQKLIPTLHALNRIRREAPATQCVYVANHDAPLAALSQYASQRDNSSNVIRHDNSGMEFGAYQAGLEHLLSTIDPDWVLFANDTFATHHSFGAIHRSKLVADLAREVDHPALIGQVVSLPRSYQIERLRTHRWVTTNLFALNRAAICAADHRVYRPELDSIVNETSVMESFFSSRIDAVLREHMEAWLFRAHPGWHWYASEPLQPTNANRMARKARSIIQEKYLAALLEDHGASFVDLNDLTVYRKVLREIDRKLFAMRQKSTA